MKIIVALVALTTMSFFVPKTSFAIWQEDAVIVDPDGADNTDSSYNDGFKDGGWFSYPIGHESVAHDNNVSFSGIQSSGHSEHHFLSKTFHWVDPTALPDSITIDYHAEISGATESTSGAGASSNVIRGSGSVIIGDSVEGNGSPFNYQQGVDSGFGEIFTGEKPTTYTFSWITYSNASGYRYPTGIYTSWAKSSMYISGVE